MVLYWKSIQLNIVKSIYCIYLRYFSCYFCTLEVELRFFCSCQASVILPSSSLPCFLFLINIYEFCKKCEEELDPGMYCVGRVETVLMVLRHS